MMSDVKHDEQCAILRVPLVKSDPVPDCTCGAKRIAELEARVRELELEIHEMDGEAREYKDLNRKLKGQLAHARNLLENHRGKVASLLDELERKVAES